MYQKTKVTSEVGVGSDLVFWAISWAQVKFWIYRPVIAINLLSIKLSKTYSRVAESHPYSIRFSNC